MALPDARLIGLVAVGGAIGAVGRYLVGIALTRTAFPLGTLLVNVLGSFVLAFLLFHDLQRGSLNASARAFLGIGILGAFTTMSTLSYETTALWTEGEAGKATLNVTLNLVLSLAGALAGRIAALLLAEARPT